jgi:hypothetical protein
MALKRSTCSEGAESGGLDAWVIRLSFTGPPPQLEHKPWSSHIVRGLTRRLAGSLIVFALLVGNVRVGSGSLIVSTLLVEDVRVGAGLRIVFALFGGRPTPGR